MLGGDGDRILIQKIHSSNFSDYSKKKKERGAHRKLGNKSEEMRSGAGLFLKLIFN